MGVLLVMGMTSLAGCAVGKEETILFYNYGENIDDETLQAFEKEYGIKVKMDEFDDMETMHLQLTGSDAKYDVILVSDALMPKMIEEGALQPLNKDNIPSLAQMDEQYLDLAVDPGNKYSVPYMCGTIGIVYDKNQVTEPGESWDIMWDPKYKGKVFMFDTYRDTLGAALKRLGYSMNSENPEELEAAKASLLEQRELVDPIYGVDNGTSMIAKGETALNMIWSGEGLNLQDEYPNLVYTIPEEGVNFWIDSLCIPANATNVSGAEKFINFISEKESALRIADAIGYTTPNKEAKMLQPDKVKDNPNAYMSEELMKLSEIYTPLSNEVKQMYDKVWTEIKAN